MINTPEERVFMFLELDSSTPIAKKMNHVKFSRFIQDCFLDLSGSVLKCGGIVYQFVGDEAVITWRASHKFDYSVCVELYFAYMNQLKKKKGFI